MAALTIRPAAITQDMDAGSHGKRVMRVQQTLVFLPLDRMDTSQSLSEFNNARFSSSTTADVSDCTFMAASLVDISTEACGE